MVNVSLPTLAIGLRFGETQVLTYRDGAPVDKLFLERLNWAPLHPDPSGNCVGLKYQQLYTIPCNQLGKSFSCFMWFYYFGKLSI